MKCKSILCHKSLKKIRHFKTSFLRFTLESHNDSCVTGLPIRCVEWTSNQMFGFVETIVVGNSLPTNITEVYKLNVGPKLKDLKNLKKPVLSWLVEKLQA